MTCEYCGRGAQPAGVVSCYGCGAALQRVAPSTVVRDGGDVWWTGYGAGGGGGSGSVIVTFAGTLYGKPVYR